MKQFLAIDGNSILNRAFYGIKNLNNSKGEPTNAVYGFLNILAKTIKQINPDYIMTAFDLKGPTFRHKQYKEYKANRHGMPDDLAVQVPVTKKMLELLGIKIVEVEGYEGDDVLGSAKRICKQNKVSAVILSGDRDCLQLVDTNTKVMLAGNKETKTYDETAVFEEYGVAPLQLIDIKALMGDASDNIPGVAGIGKKTAAELIKQYRSVDEVFANLENVKGRAYNLLKAEGAKEAAYLSYKLGKISDEAPICGDMKEYEVNCCGDENEIKEFFDRLEFKNYRDKIAFAVGAQKPVQIEPSPTVKGEDPDVLEQKLKKEKRLIFLYSDSLMIFLGNKVYEFNEDTNRLYDKLVLENGKEKWTYNLKEMHKKADLLGKELKNVTASAEISGYLLDVLAKSYTPEDLRDKYLKAGRLPECFADIMDIMEREIKDKSMEFLEKEIEIPLSYVLYEMEKNGFAVDVKGLKEWGGQFEGSIDKLEDEITEMAGEKFNINSPKEVGAILFEKLGLPPQGKTKIGYSTDAGVLRKLVKYHPIAGKILKYRTASKLKSTYVEGLIKNVSEDGRIHSVFNQTETRTGRISSREPNMQNIPIRTEFTSTFRKFFIAPKDRVLIDADYSQIELRVLADLSGDKIMTEAFLNNVDIHLVTASQVFSLDPIFVPPELRRRAKVINFSIIYGAGAYSLAQDLGVSVKEAGDYINRYFKTYSTVKKYLDGVVADAQNRGYVKTMFGRIRNIPEFNSNSYNIKEFAKRAAKNTAVQGSAADIIKIAMVKVSRRIKEEKLDAKLILQVHDELLIESSKEDEKRAAAVLKEEMEHAVNLKVPLIVKVTSGQNWCEAKKE